MEKLNELRGTSKPVEARHTEAALRPEAENALRHAIVRFRRFVDEYRAGDEKYVHIDSKLVEKVYTVFLIFSLGLSWVDRERKRERERERERQRERERERKRKKKKKGKRKRREKKESIL